MYFQTVVVMLFAISTLSVNGRRIVPKSYSPRVVSSSQQDNCPIESDMQDTRSEIMSDIQGILRNNVVPALQCNLGECENNPALSCSQIFTQNPSAGSGNYWLQSCGEQPVQVYCTSENPCGCNSTGAWMRIAFLNTSDTDAICPHGMNLLETPVKSCER